MFVINRIQDHLNFRSCTSTHFKSEESPGRIGVAGAVLGFIGGVHLCGIGMCIFLICSDIGTTLEFDSTSVSILLKWCTYMTFLSLFHFLEFFVTAVRQPGNSVTYNSFVINHSTHYTIAALFSWVEFWISFLVFPAYTHIKASTYVYWLGLLLVCTGQAVRSAAMWQCGDNFDHQIMVEKKTNHRLVTNGIYRFFRHPSYFGWFYWSIGTQVLLCNPISTLAYTLASWRFFRGRIPVEESLLLQFYGAQYLNYMKSSYIGIPFIKNASARNAEISCRSSSNSSSSSYSCSNKNR